MLQVPDLTTANDGPHDLYCKSIKFRKVKGKPTYNADFELEFGIGEAAETDIRLPAIIQHARSVLIGALAGQPSGKIQADPLLEGNVSLACMVDGAPERFVDDANAILRRVTLHATAKNARVVYLLRVDISLALAEVILSCLDSDLDVRFTPRQQELPLGSSAAEDDDESEEPEEAPAPKRESRRRRGASMVEDLTDDENGLPAEA